MFSAVSAMDALCNFLGAFIFNPMYVRALKFGLPGLPFLVAAALVIIPLVIVRYKFCAELIIINTLMF